MQNLKWKFSSILAKKKTIFFNPKNFEIALATASHLMHKRNLYQNL